MGRIIERFNDWFALKITQGVATMWCAYFFAFLAIIGFPFGADTIGPYVQWVSQTFIQLTMLSIIMVGQDLMQKQQNDHHKKHTEHLDRILTHVRKHSVNKLPDNP